MMFPFGFWASNEDGIVILKKDLIPTDHASSYKSRNNTKVDWGDGFIEDVPANTQANHVYTATSGEVTVRITDISAPRTRGMNIDFSLIHASSTEHDPGWKEAVITDSLMEGFACRPGRWVSVPRLKKLHVVGKQRIGDFISIVCNDIEELIIDDLNKSANCIYMSKDSTTLKHVKLGISDGQIDNRSYSQFEGSRALELVEADGSEFVRTESMFINAGAATGFEYRTKNPPTMTNAGSMFFGSTVTVFPTSYPELDIAYGMFRQTRKLIDVPVLSMPKVTHVVNMFNNAASIVTIGGIPDSARLTDIRGLLIGCTALKHVGDIDCSAVTNAGANVYSDQIAREVRELLTIKLNGITVSFSLADCSKLTTAVMDDIYTRLGTAQTGATLWMPKTAAFTASNKSIATGKGWTLATI